MEDKVNRYRVLAIIKGLLALCLLGYIVYILEVRTIVHSLKEARLSFIFLALSLLPINIGLELLKWHTMQRKLSSTVTLAESLGAILSGYSLGILTPARMGEHVGRALFHKHPDRWQVTFLSFIDRMHNLTCYIGLGIPALLFFIKTRTIEQHELWYPILLSGAVVFGILLMLILSPRFAALLFTRTLPEKVRHHVLPVIASYSRRDALKLGGLSVLRYAVFTTQFFLLLLAFAPDIPLREAYAGIAAIYFTKSALPSMTFMDLGIREGAAIFFLGSLGIPRVAAFNASLMIFMFNLLLPALVGIPTLFHLHLPAAAREFFNRSAV